MRGHGNEGWHWLFLCFDLIYFICSWLEDITALLFFLEEYPAGPLASPSWLRRLRLLVRAEWISAHQCDLIMKAQFHFFFLYLLCYATVIVLVLLSLQVRVHVIPRAPTLGFFLLCIFTNTTQLSSRGWENSLSSPLGLISSCVRANDSITALHHCLGLLAGLPIRTQGCCFFFFLMLEMDHTL